MVEEKKNKGKGIYILFGITILIILGLAFYICYDKGILFSDKKVQEKGSQTELEQQEEEKKEELDIHSRLVQNLYSKVSKSDDEVDPIRYWYYLDLSNISDGFSYKNQVNDVTVLDMKEELKMQLVAKNLLESDKIIVSCYKNIPDKVSDYFSGCYMQRTEQNNNYSQYGYKKETVERVYKELFGMNATLNTDVPIRMSVEGGAYLYYNKDMNMYLSYFALGVGGTFGGGGYKATLTRAVKTNDRIELYEKVDYVEINSNNPEGQTTETMTLVYSFEEESDGMYRFVQRKKES